MTHKERAAMKHCLNFINHCDSSEIGEISIAVQRRYQVLFPDYEVSYLVLPKHDIENRVRDIQSIIDFLEAAKSSPIF